MNLNKYDLIFIEKELTNGIHVLASCPDCRSRRKIAAKVASMITDIQWSAIGEQVEKSA